ncbi:uncharacterized protein BCR38DRAFT_505137 [Pseudomassariella vexata]|uniref:Glucose receptor Git3 N-terminal domain-containing protein n=1 Tax=Pseudomassariella vexata TaxID=1141098 RepID=A0A1Y2DAT2_9PEZI|nr:uncharacterized protein BCR38DRAFT_505137 [Pseudomassariella vexata]ORY56307.1 hypothetical protein BCR38DRAFT_505137 [Pseudomassariella vexata]
MAAFWKPDVAIPTLVGSLSSFVATSIVVLLWLISHGAKDNLRYALIINLTFAGGLMLTTKSWLQELINSLNNSISGSYVVATRQSVPPGDTCSANGWIGQVKKKAADFSILAIAIATLLTIKRTPWILNPSFTKKYFICLSTWLTPLATATTALAMGKMSAVSGNWCWISMDPRGLRYILGHGWRFSIFIATTIIYAVIFRQLQYRLRSREKYNRTFSFYPGSMNPAVELSLRRSHQSLLGGEGQHQTGSVMPRDQALHTNVWRERDDEQLPSDLPVHPIRAQRPSYSSTLCDESTLKSDFQPRLRVTESSQLDQDTWQWVLMVFYPLTYVLLWIPGIANRMVELMGTEYRWLTVMQASTQCTGLVNSIIYGLREHRGIWKTWVNRYIDRHYSA